MKLYWKRENNTTWRLLAEPAAICFSLVRSVGEWKASCLGENLKLEDMSLKDAQRLSLDWFQETLDKLGRVVSELRSES
jgi:hypothetical protein